MAVLDGPPNALINCHCGLCRSLSGAAFSTWATIPREEVTVLENGPLRHFQASKNVTRSFFEVCGTHVFSIDIRLAGKIGIPAGIMQGWSASHLSAHYFVDDKARWHEIGDTAPRFGGETGYQPLDEVGP